MLQYLNTAMQCAHKGYTEVPPPTKTPCWERAHPLQCILEAGASKSSAPGALNPALHPTPAICTQPGPSQLHSISPPHLLRARSVQAYHHPLRSKPDDLRPPARVSSLSSTTCVASDCSCRRLSRKSPMLLSCWICPVPELYSGSPHTLLPASPSPDPSNQAHSH